MYKSVNMSTVTVQTLDAGRARDLLTLYAKKAAFVLEEYSDVGAIFKNLNEVLTEDSGENVELSKTDVTFLVNMINVCSQRAAIEVQNYKPIAALHEAFSEALKTTESSKKVEEL